jgi:hypothetical protein
MVRSARAMTLALVVMGRGCSSDVEKPTYEVGLFPHVAHSGFNANAPFRVMFATGGSNPKWAVSDPSIATIEPSAPPSISGEKVDHLQFALVKTLKAGETNVTMTSGDTTLTARLVVKAYTDEQLAAGQKRYADASSDPTRPPCSSCHAKDGGNGVDHSPLKMAGFDDPTILGVIQQATYPPSGTGQSTTSAYSPKGPLKFAGHKWNLSDPEKDGILAYLRSLPLGGI